MGYLSLVLPYRMLLRLQSKRSDHEAMKYVVDCPSFHSERVSDRYSFYSFIMAGKPLYRFHNAQKAYLKEPY